MKTTTIAQIKNGEIFRLTENGPEWVRGEYDRTDKKFECSKWDDVNHSSYMKGTRKVFVGFEF